MLQLKDQRIGFIGGGNMAQAIITGLLAKGIKPSQLLVADPSVDIHRALKTKKIKAIDPTQEPDAVPKSSDVLVLAVKPQHMQAVTEPFADVLQAHQLVISVAAGLSTQQLSGFLKGHMNVVRVMPNTPATVQMAATGLFAADAVDHESRQIAEALMACVGMTIWVKEEAHLHAVTAVAGSAPAYFFYMLEAMIQAAVDMGLPATDAQALAMQTALGAAQMAITSEASPQQLRKQVTSPNGTTQAAIEALQDKAFAQVVGAAMQACYQRSEAIAQSNQ